MSQFAPLEDEDDEDDHQELDEEDGEDTEDDYDEGRSSGKRRLLGDGENADRSKRRRVDREVSSILVS